MHVYFFCLPQGTFKKPAYQYQTIALAQGFKEIGITCSSNIPFWFEDDKPSMSLIGRDDSISPEEADLIILPCQWFYYGESLPEVFKISKERRKGKTVLIDICDGWIGEQRRKLWKSFDLVLTYIYEGFSYPDHCRPWAYGLIQYLIEFSNAHPRSGVDRELTYMCGSRNHHPVRSLAHHMLEPLVSTFMNVDNSIIEPDSECTEELAQLYYERSGGRHAKAYLERMAQTKACGTFGGYFLLSPFVDQFDLGFSLGTYLVEGRGESRLRRISKRLIHIKQTERIYQWDSWRFWEAFVMGAINLHVDLAQYGIKMPVMPQNEVDYVGIKFNQTIEATKLKNILMDSELGHNGKQFALKHYSPKASALRLLSYLRLA